MSPYLTIPSLSQGWVHIWRLDLAGSPFADSAKVLDAADREKAGRFIFQRDRDRCLRSRYAMRHILGDYLGIDPRQVPLMLNPEGKPLLTEGYELGFNLSHSGDRAVLAVGRSELGIDIEILKPIANMRDLAATVFSHSELASLDELPDADLPLSFFTCWTRKEACLKAIGSGFSIDPCSVTVGIDTRPCRAKIQGETSLVNVSTVSVGDNEVISLACHDDPIDVTFLEYGSSDQSSREAVA